MTEVDKKEKELYNENNEDLNKESTEKLDSPTKEETLEDKFKATEEKLLRTMAEMENQRRRSEKEKLEAFEFGGFNFAKESLSLLDNIDRAITSFRNDKSLNNNKDLDKIIESIEIVKNALSVPFALITHYSNRL